MNAEPSAGPGIRVVTVPYSDPHVDAVLPEGVVRAVHAQVYAQVVADRAG